MLRLALTPRFLIPTLGYLGLIPFAGLALLMLGVPWQSPVDAVTGFVTYSALILSFLAGSLWGRSLGPAPDRPAFWLLLASNLIVLLAWFVLLLGSDLRVTLICLMFGYVFLLYLESQVREVLFADLGQGRESEYLRLRFTLTTLVLLAHLTLVLAL